MEKYTENFKITSYQVDAYKNLRPSSFMQIAQEMALDAADPIGFGYDAMSAYSAAWVLSRMRFVIHKSPKWREQVTAYTWHKGLNGLFFLRDYQLKDKDGTLLVDGTSSWIILNTETRRLMRPTSIPVVSADPQCTDNAIEEPAPKIEIPSDVQMETVSEHKVVYSDVDFLGHTNNTQYIAWVMDCIDPEMLSAHPVTEVSINFNHELLPGQTVQIRKGISGSTIYFEGVAGEMSSFLAEIKL